jgi:Calcium binding
MHYLTQATRAQKPPQNIMRLSPALFRLFALECFQGVECESQVVTRLAFWEKASRSGCSPIFTRYRRMHMTRQAKAEAREQRIHMEIVVDAYGPEEQAISWYNYLSDTLQFPFSARCIVRRATSPLGLGDRAEVVGMAPEEECEHDMFVLIRWKRRQLAVPLMQLEGIQVPASHSARGHRASDLAADYRSWQDLPGTSSSVSAASDGVGELPFTPVYDWRGAVRRARS